VNVRAAVFVDRDGVLNELVPNPSTGVPESPLSVAQVRLLAGSARALSRLAQSGYALVCVSNQPAAAKAEASCGQLRAVHRRVIGLLEREGARIHCSRLCMHHPDGLVAGLARSCACRKPAPGMLLEAAEAFSLDLRASWMIGDTDADVLAGAAAGCKTILIEHAGSAHKRAGLAMPDLRARDLADAAALLLRG